jgi:hypothetical protein
VAEQARQQGGTSRHEHSDIVKQMTVVHMLAKVQAGSHR